jgi:cell division septation protein DedD
LTDSHQQSYYELALTNRQVMVAFVVLLTCIFVAFFSGIWIGRQEDSQQVLEASQQTVEAAADALDLGTLQFFSDSGGESKREPLKAQKAGTTLAEDVGVQKARQDAATEPPAAAPPRQRQPEPAATVPAEPPAPATRVAETVAPSSQAPPAGDLLFIQVFSSADAKQAQNLREKLLKADFAASISPVEVGGRTMHRVRIGPFGDRAEATSVADKVRREFKLDTWITQ